MEEERFLPDSGRGANFNVGLLAFEGARLVPAVLSVAAFWLPPAEEEEYEEVEAVVVAVFALSELDVRDSHLPTPPPPPLPGFAAPAAPGEVPRRWLPESLLPPNGFKRIPPRLMGLLPGSDSAGLTGISSEVDASGSSVPAACFLGERMSDMRQRSPLCKSRAQAD